MSMKKTWKRAIGCFLSAGLMLTASFGAAAAVYDTTIPEGEELSIVGAKILPGDSVSGAGALYLSQEDADAGNSADISSGTWTNSSAAVYKASVYSQGSGEYTAEDGTVVAAAGPGILLSRKGYAFEVSGGTAAETYPISDNEADAQLHKFTAGSVMLADGSSLNPAGYYADEGVSVTLTPDAAPDGQTFAGWKLYDTDGNSVSADSLYLTEGDLLGGDGGALEYSVAATDRVTVFAASYAAAAPETEAAPQTEAPADAAIDGTQASAPADDSAALDAQIDIDPSTVTEETAGPESDAAQPETPEAVDLTAETAAAAEQVTLHNIVIDDGSQSLLVMHETGESFNITAPVFEGKTFAAWTVMDSSTNEYLDASGILADPNADATTVTTPDRDITITALYNAVETQAPETTAPETTAPETTAPETSAPETQSPETAAPETQPATDAPQTEAPAPLTEQPQEDTVYTFELNDDSASVTSLSPDTTVVEKQDDGSYKVTVLAGTDPAQLVVTPSEENGQTADLTAVNSADGSAVSVQANADGSYFLMPGNLVATIIYTQDSYLVTVNNGSVDGEEFMSGDEVSVSADDIKGMQFDHWTVNSGNVSIDDPTAKDATFVMPDGDVEITAEYVNTYTISIADASVNDVTYDGIPAAGQTITLYAAQHDDREFIGFTVLDESGNAVKTSYAAANSATFKMPESNVTVQADYEETAEYKLTVKRGEGSGTYKDGTSVSIKAAAAEDGWRFKGWAVTEGKGTIEDASKEETVFTVSGSDATVTAQYEQIAFTLTVDSGSGAGTYHSGDQVQISASYPAAGQEFDQWTVKSGSATISSPTSYSTVVTMGTDNAAVAASYKAGPSADSNAITGLDDGGEYLKGTTLSFTAVGAGMENANPNPGDYRYRPTGYQISNVTGSYTQAPYTTNLAINAAGDYVVTVTFAKDVYDGSQWNADGTTVQKSITVHVVNALSVKTGDTSPILPLALLGAGALVLIIVLIVVMRKRNKES